MDKRSFGKIVAAVAGGAIVGSLLDRYALPKESSGFAGSPASKGSGSAKEVVEYRKDMSIIAAKVQALIKELEVLHKSGRISDESYNTLSNLAKDAHDASMAAIQNTR